MYRNPGGERAAKMPPASTLQSLWTRAASGGSSPSDVAFSGGDTHETSHLCRPYRCGYLGGNLPCHVRGKLYHWHMAAYELFIDRIGHKGDQSSRPPDRIYSVFSRRAYGHVSYRRRVKAARVRKLH